MAKPICKYDEIIHLVCETKQKQSVITKRVKELFPLFSRNVKKYIFHEYASPSKIEMYAYYRSLGMSVADSSNAVGLSHCIMERMLNGEGIPLDVLVDLAQAEIFTKAECKAKHLKNLEDDEGKGAALQFLQTVYPQEYRKDAIINNLTVNNNANTDPEKEMKDRRIPIPKNGLEDIDEVVKDES